MWSQHHLYLGMVDSNKLLIFSEVRRFSIRLSEARLNASLSILSSLTLALLAIAQSRFLGPQDRGMVVLLLSVSGSCSILGSLGYGLSRVGSPFISLNFAEIKNHIALSNLLSQISLILLSFSHDGIFNSISFIFVAISTTSLTLMFLVLDITFSSRHSFKIRITIYLLSLIEFFSVLFLGLTNKLTITNTILVSGIAAIINTVILIYIVRHEIDIKSEKQKGLLFGWRYMITYLASYQFVYLYRLPAGFVISPSEIANLTIAFSFAFMGMPFIYHVSQYLKVSSTTYQKVHLRKKKNLVVSLSLLVTYSSILVICSNFIIENTVGRDFYEAAALLRWIAVGLPFFAILVFYRSAKEGIEGKPNFLSNLAYLVACTSGIVLSGKVGGIISICIFFSTLHILLGSQAGFKLMKIFSS